MDITELRTFLYGWLRGAKAALERGQLPPERFDELIDTLKLTPAPATHDLATLQGQLTLLAKALQVEADESVIPSEETRTRLRLIAAELLKLAGAP